MDGEKRDIPFTPIYLSSLIFHHPPLFTLCSRYTNVGEDSETGRLKIKMAESFGQFPKFIKGQYWGRTTRMLGN